MRKHLRIPTWSSSTSVCLLFLLYVPLPSPSSSSSFHLICCCLFISPPPPLLLLFSPSSLLPHSLCFKTPRLFFFMFPSPASPPHPLFLSDVSCVFFPSSSSFLFSSSSFLPLLRSHEHVVSFPRHFLHYHPTLAHFSPLFLPVFCPSFPPSERKIKVFGSPRG